MNKHILQIDLLKSKYEKEEDLINIRLGSEDLVKINFSIFFIQSKYLRDKYRYSEAINNIEQEINTFCKEKRMNCEVIKLFIDLIEEEKVNLPLEHYKDFYRLSKHFNIQRFIDELEYIKEEELFSDLDFTLQILHKEEDKEDDDFEDFDDDDDTNISYKIEKYLMSRINECICSKKFWELPVSVIYRIFEGADEEIVNKELLIENICKSIDNHFFLLKFVELQKLRKDQIDFIFKKIDEQKEETKKRCFQYMTPNARFFERIVTQHNILKKKIRETDDELKQTKTKLTETNDELKQTKTKLTETDNELKQTKTKLTETDNELKQTKTKLTETDNELKQTKTKLTETDNELKQTKTKYNQHKNENLNMIIDLERAKEEQSRQKKKTESESEESFTKRVNKQCAQSIVVGGLDNRNQLGVKPNNKNTTLNPPQNSPLDPSSLLSYSIYMCHSVIVRRDDSLEGIGYNCDGRITSSLTKKDFSQFTKFSIKDDSGNTLKPISAICNTYSTLYMFSKSSGSGRQLVLCDREIDDGNPVFLVIGNHEPLSLFGGYYHSAAIGREGEIIFINRDAVKKSPNLPISAFLLPFGEKASSIACCYNTVFVLSSSGHVYCSRFMQNSSYLEFSIVSELVEEEIIWLSGTNEHCLVVNKKGQVFGCGSNFYGELGLGEKNKSVTKFIEISSLLGYKIKAAYAGSYYSLFETQEGKILSCGSNCYGQLLLDSEKDKYVYSPRETTITEGATFCIAGECLSAVFVGGDPPPNTPNMPIQHQP